MRVGFYQSDVTPGDRRGNLDRMAAALSGESFDLVVLTELFATGYGFADRTDVAAQSEAVPAGLTTGALIDIARSTRAFIVGSLVEADGDRCFNTAVVAGPHGFVGRHRKSTCPTSSGATSIPVNRTRRCSTSMAFGSAWSSASRAGSLSTAAGSRLAERTFSATRRISAARCRPT